jgi:ATP-dependent helicase HepA
LLNLLQSAADKDHGEPLTHVEVESLDGLHHSKWIEAQANHIAENRQLVEHRIQSLSVSHRARCKAIEDQIVRATNEKIRLMKQSELARAEADFTRRMEQLQRAANSGDIHVTAVLYGTINVSGKDDP